MTNKIPERELDHVLGDLASRGVLLWVVDGNLYFKAPQGAMTEALRASLTRCKREIVNALTGPVYEPEGSGRAPQPMLEGARRFWQRIKSGQTDIRLEHGTRFVARIRAHIDLKVMEQTIGFLVSRHSALQARIVEIGDVPSFSFDGAQRVALSVTDLSSRLGESTDDSIRRVVQANVWTPLDLRAGPPFRPFLIKIGDSDWIVGFVLHHLLCDLWSVNLLANEMIVAYTAFALSSEVPLERSPLQYSDYIQAMSGWLGGPAARLRLDYWKQRLRDAKTSTLPQRWSDLPEGAHIRHVAFTVEQESVERLRSLAKDKGVSLFTILLAAKALTLSHFNRQSDIVVVMLVSGRNDPVLCTMVGGTVTYIPLRVTLVADMPFAQLLDQVHAAFSAACKHHLPSYMIESALKDAGSSAVFPMLNFVPHSSKSFTENGFPGIIEPVEVPEPLQALSVDDKCSTHWMHIAESAEELDGNLGYSSMMYHSGEIESFLLAFRSVLQAVARDSTRTAASLTLTISTALASAQSTESCFEHV
jgi:hypothetical protein